MKTKENNFNILPYQILIVVELRFTNRFVGNNLLNLSVKHLTFEMNSIYAFPLYKTHELSTRLNKLQSIIHSQSMHLWYSGFLTHHKG